VGKQPRLGKSIYTLFNDFQSPFHTHIPKFVNLLIGIAAKRLGMSKETSKGGKERGNKRGKERQFAPAKQAANVLVLKDRILENTEFQKTGSYVTGRPDFSGPSLREVKIDLWKYFQTIIMGLYEICEQKLAHPDRVLSHTSQKQNKL